MQTFELCQVELHKIFMDPTIAFISNAFMSFQALVDGRHETILIRWIINFNSRIGQLAFDRVWANAQDFDTKVTCYVTGPIFDHIVLGVKL
jgi:hypothetical protein